MELLSDFEQFQIFIAGVTNAFTLLIFFVLLRQMLLMERQTKILIESHNMSHKAAIGAHDNLVSRTVIKNQNLQNNEGFDKNMWSLLFRNYGNLEAINCLIRTEIYEERPSMEQINKLEHMEHRRTIIFPNQSTATLLEPTEKQYETLLGDSPRLYIGVLINFEYAKNRTGEFKCIIFYETTNIAKIVDQSLITN